MDVDEKKQIHLKQSMVEEMYDAFKKNNFFNYEALINIK
jgi:hypothetical protein